MPKKVNPKVELARRVVESVSPDPLLLSALLQAKGALIETQTPHSYSAVKRIMELESGLQAKTVLLASAIQTAKALASRQVAGSSIHPDEIGELLSKFHVL